MLCTSVDPGKLDEKLTVQEEVTLDDGMGGRTTEWNTIGTAWARVTASRGGETVINESERSVIGYDIWVRNLGAGARITEQHRLLRGAETLNVKRAPPTPRDAFRQIRAESGVVT